MSVRNHFLLLLRLAQLERKLQERQAKSASQDWLGSRGVVVVSASVVYPGINGGKVARWSGSRLVKRELVMVLRGWIS